jgi:hypothetical protein
MTRRLHILSTTAPAVKGYKIRSVFHLPTYPFTSYSSYYSFLHSYLFVDFCLLENLITPIRAPRTPHNHDTRDQAREGKVHAYSR